MSYLNQGLWSNPIIFIKAAFIVEGSFLSCLQHLFLLVQQRGYIRIVHVPTVIEFAACIHNLIYFFAV